MSSIRSLLVAACSRMDRADAESLLMHVLGRNRAWLLAHADELADAQHASAFEALARRREAGEPVAYLTGTREFWSLQLEVSAATLIPRPETELLVELALQHMPENRACAVADLGTGSGAVALALASERPRAQVLASDNSIAALDVARRNARRLQLANVAFAHGDWCAALGDTRFDVIVSNPPYIEASDPHLAQGDLRFEPDSALLAGDDGLDAIRSIVNCAGKHLAAKAWLLFEHGWQQGGVARSLLSAAGYIEVFTATDLEGRDRVSGGRMR